MVRGQFKSSTFRKISVKTPGGRVSVHYRLKKPAKAQCANCGEYLQAVMHERPVVMKNTPKTKKRPQRRYGGVLCSACSRKELIKQTISSDK